MFENEIQAAAARYGVPATWIKAVIQVESAWNADAYRAEPQIGDGSYGLMQLLYKTAQRLGYTGTPEGLFDPVVNINFGTKLLAQLRASYGDDFRRVYSAYNSGKPDLWQTSEEVAANVARALAALLSYSQENPGTSVTVLVMLFLLWWVFRKKKK